jgi:hypothetical protein
MSLCTANVLPTAQQRTKAVGEVRHVLFFGFFFLLTIKLLPALRDRVFTLIVRRSSGCGPRQSRWAATLTPMFRRLSPTISLLLPPPCFLFVLLLLRDADI